MESMSDPETNIGLPGEDRGHPPCPKCGGASARIAYGLIYPPSADDRKMQPDTDRFWKRVHAGEIVLGGCVIGSEKWKCHECEHRWPDHD